MAHQLQSCVLLFHHHVEQNDRDTVVLGQHQTRLLRRIGMQKLEPTIVEDYIRKRDARHLMHFFLIIDDQNLPRGNRLGRHSISFRSEQEVIQHHAPRRSPVAGMTGGATSPSSRSCGLRGKRRMKVVPTPSWLSTLICPCSGPVTRLWMMFSP